MGYAEVAETMVIVLFIWWAVFAVLVGLLAKRKNRSLILWGLVGGLPPYNWIIAFILLAFLPFLCPRCRGRMNKRQWNERICPHCGPLVKK